MSQTTKPSSTTLTVLLSDDSAADYLPTAWPEGVLVRYFDGCRKEGVADARRLFVIVTATRLKDVAPCISAASHANRLQALLVRTDVDPSWVPFMFEQAQLRVLRNMIVHSDVDLPNRLLSAWAHNEEHDTIADATVAGEELIVRSCAFDVHRIRFDAYPALRRIRPEDRSRFMIDEDGIFLHWPSADVHLDLEAIQTANDPSLRDRLRTRQLAESANFGAAVRALRLEHGMSQSEITRRSGLSERQVRRVENDEPLGNDALAALAKAHRMDTNEYLNALSEHMPTQRIDRAGIPDNASDSEATRVDLARISRVSNQIHEHKARGNAVGTTGAPNVTDAVVFASPNTKHVSSFAPWRTVAVSFVEAPRTPSSKTPSKTPSSIAAKEMSYVTI